MKSFANQHRPAAASAPQGWMPSQPMAPRALVRHFLSRAARGHTWNSHGAERRRAH
jgi:hypothetical protein